MRDTIATIICFVIVGLTIVSTTYLIYNPKICPVVAPVVKESEF